MKLAKPKGRMRKGNRVGHMGQHMENATPAGCGLVGRQGLVRNRLVVAWKVTIAVMSSLTSEIRRTPADRVCPLTSDLRPLYESSGHCAWSSVVMRTLVRKTSSKMPWCGFQERVREVTARNEQPINNLLAALQCGLLTL